VRVLSILYHRWFAPSSVLDLVFENAIYLLEVPVLDIAKLIGVKLSRSRSHL
jgi:hypothetical protein